MILLLLLNSLTVLAEGLKFYDTVGSMSEADIEPRDCYIGNAGFRCEHVKACTKWLRGLSRMCDRRNTRRLQMQAQADRVQYDDYGRGRSRVQPPNNPYFVTSLRNVTVNEGTTVTIKCAASGNPVPRVAISSLHAYRKLFYNSRYNRYNGYRQVNTEFTIFNITRKNAGWYRCAAVNSNSYQITDSYITVITDPCLNIKCDDLKTCVNDNGVGRCECPQQSACSDEPLHPLCGNDCISYFNLCTMRVRACMSGLNISVWLDNDVCPAIEEPSVSYITNSKRIIQAGASLRLSCGAKGNPPPEVAWYRQERSGLVLVSAHDMLELRQISRDQAGKYLCTATNCISHSIRSKVINVNVLDIKRTSRKVCHVFGDPHVTTFSGSMYSFVGGCDYVLAMDCGHDPKWFLYGRVRPCGEKSSCLESITAISQGTIVQFLRGWIINNNGSTVIIAPGGKIDIGHLHIAYDKSGLLYSVALGDSGIMVTWDGYSSATIIASKPVHSCGLCGGYDAEADNNIEKSWFSGFYNNVEVQSDPNDVSANVGSWKLDQWHMQCPKTVADVNGPLTDTCTDDTEKAIVEEECRNVIESNEFGHCLHSDDQKIFYIRACIRDTCGHDAEWAFCEFVESVKQHCEQETEMEVRDLNISQCPDKAGRKLQMIRHLL